MNMKFKAHNCKVIDTRQATWFDHAAPRGQEVKMRTGGITQTVVYREVVNAIPKRRAFVK